jgi:hypothetical protein
MNMDMSGFINLVLKVMLLTGLTAGLLFIGLHMLIRKLEEAPRDSGRQ